MSRSAKCNRFEQSLVVCGLMRFCIVLMHMISSIIRLVEHIHIAPLQPPKTPIKHGPSSPLVDFRKYDGLYYKGW